MKLISLKPHSFKEGFCKKSVKCGVNKNDTGRRKDIDWSWIIYVVFVILIIALFFILPKEEEWISLVALGVVAGVAILIAFFKWITKPSCSKCFKPKKIDVVALTQEQLLAESIQKAEEQDIKIEERIMYDIHCPGGKKFDPDEEPPGSTTVAGFNYDKCIRSGFNLDFCVETPLFHMGPGTCRCRNGKIGYIDPDNKASCDCPE